MKLVLVCLTVLLLVASAGAGQARRTQRSASLVVMVGASRVSASSGRAIPAKAAVRCDLSFNGQTAQMIWTDSRWEIEYAWHGVIATLSASSRRAVPFVVRAASTRADVVRVYAICWY